MKNPMISLIAAAAFAGILLAGQSCPAADGQPQVGEQTIVAGFAEFGQAATDDELGFESGGQATEIDEIYMQINNVGMNGNLDNNVLDSNTTGANFIGYDAFSNMNGFATVIQNSGNQVLIESVTVVNVTMK
jgi:hypothetical protein